MTAVDEIKQAIVKLSLEERSELARWLHDWQDDDWDQQIKKDATAGNLDFLFNQARAELKAGKTRDLP